MKKEVLKMIFITLPAIVIYTLLFNWAWKEYIYGYSFTQSAYIKLTIFGLGLILLVRFTAAGFFRKIREIERGKKGAAD